MKGQWGKQAIISVLAGLCSGEISTKLPVAPAGGEVWGRASGARGLREENKSS